MARLCVATQGLRNTVLESVYKWWFIKQWYLKNIRDIWEKKPKKFGLFKSVNFSKKILEGKIFFFVKMKMRPGEDPDEVVEGNTLKNQKVGTFDNYMIWYSINDLALMKIWINEPDLQYRCILDRRERRWEWSDQIF
jgi:hypothetical protein